MRRKIDHRACRRSQRRLLKANPTRAQAGQEQIRCGMECPSCDSANADGKNVCRDCGRPLSVRCAACGSENPSGKRFCGDCGAALMPTGAARVSAAAGRVDVLRAAAIRTVDLATGTKFFRGAPSAHSDVLRPRRLDGACGTARSGRSTRDHCRISRWRRGDRPQIWRHHQSLHWRWHADPVRPSFGARG